VPIEKRIHIHKPNKMNAMPYDTTTKHQHQYY